MDAEEVTQFLRKLGISGRLLVQPKWIKSPCPLARWTHGKGTDNDPSFGVSIHPGGESKYHCFACHAKGSIPSLLLKLSRYDRSDYSELDNWVRMHNPVAVSEHQERLDHIQANGYGGYGGRKQVGGIGVSLKLGAILADKEPDPLPESVLGQFTDPTPEVMSYLIQRGLTPQSIAAWGLRWHEGARRVAIPIRDVQGRLVAVTGRAFDADQKPKFLHSTGFRRDFYLYGENRCRKSETGYLTEGFFDVMHLQQRGINAVAVMGSYISQLQIEKCIKFFSNVVIIPDGDEPGLEGAENMKELLSRRMPTRIAKVPMGKDPDQLTDVELMRVTDTVPS
jgi:hypothetical protein